MQILDIIYSGDQRNRPGRNSLVDVADKLFNSGNTAQVAGTATVTLPPPPVGFLRLWQSLGMLSSAAAAGDVFLLTRRTPDQLIQNVLVQYTQTTLANFTLPLINGVFVDNTGNNTVTFAGWRGIDPFLVGQESVLVVIAQYAAPVAQTINVAGWYKDIAF